MPQRILIMGLPGSGKTTLARELRAQLEAAGKQVGWLNATKSANSTMTGIFQKPGVFARPNACEN